MVEAATSAINALYMVVLLWRARPEHRDCGALLLRCVREVWSVRAVVRS
jgi:hypothetical protein